MHADTRAEAFEARILPFPVLAERIALAVLAVRPPFLVRAYSRAAAIDTFIRPSPVLAFLANPGHGSLIRLQEMQIKMPLKDILNAFYFLVRPTRKMKNVF